MTNEVAAALLEIAWAYVKTDRVLPVHVVADLHDVCRTDTIAPSLRSQAQRVLRSAGVV